jgi:hypothetical protein
LGYARRKVKHSNAKTVHADSSSRWKSSGPPIPPFLEGDVDPAFFYEQCVRSMNRPLATRLKYGFVQPVHREKVNRGFKTMAEYREFCRLHYPEYLGYLSPRADI